MSQGWSPNSGWVITWDNLQKVVPAAAAEFKAALDQNKLSLDDYCRQQICADDDEACTKVDPAWKKVERAFKRATRVECVAERYGFSKRLAHHGLTIEPYWEDPEGGDIYDEKEAKGGFFLVGGVQTYTPAGKKFHKQLVYASWVRFG